MSIVFREIGDHFQKNVCDQSDEDMDFHSDLTASDITFHGKGPLEPLEEFFYRPACVIELGDGCGSQVESIRQEVIDFPLFGSRDDQAELCIHLIFSGAQGYEEIVENALVSMVSLDFLFFPDFVRGIGFESCDEEDVGRIHQVEEFIIVVGTINDIGPSLLEEPGKEFSIVHPPHGEEKLLGD